MLSRLVALTLLAIGLAPPLGAQWLAQRAGLSATAPTATAISATARREIAPSHWVRGAIIGGGVGALFGLFYLSSDNGSTNPWPALYPVAVLAVIGALIGSASKRR